MAGINLAEKFSPKVDKRVTIKSYFGQFLNKEYDFDGVKTIHIYQILTAPINYYLRKGLSRYGNPNELEDEVQTANMEQDIAWTFTIDRGNNKQEMMIKKTSENIKMQTDEVVVPYTDKYRFAILCEEVEDEMLDDTTVVSSANVYETLLAGYEKINEKGIGNESVVTYVTPAVYNMLKLDNNFIKGCDVAQKMLIKGQMGTVDGSAIIRVDGKRMPAGVKAILYPKKAMCSPVQLTDTKVHDNPPGVNGWLVEARMIFDAFVLNSRKGFIYQIGDRASALTITAGDAYTAVASGIDVYRDEKYITK